MALRDSIKQFEKSVNNIFREFEESVCTVFGELEKIDCDEEKLVKKVVMTDEEYIKLQTRISELTKRNDNQAATIRNLRAEVTKANESNIKLEEEMGVMKDIIKTLKRIRTVLGEMDLEE